MEDKEIVSTKKITQRLIGYWFLWGIVFSIIYSIIYNTIVSEVVESMILIAIIAVVLQGLMFLFIWKICTKSAFEKRTIVYDDVPKVMKYLIIFTILICVFNVIYRHIQLEDEIDETFSALTYMGSYFYDDDEMDEFEEYIESAKKELYTCIIILDVGLTVVLLAILPLEKKEILKYVSK